MPIQPRANPAVSSKDETTRRRMKPLCFILMPFGRKAAPAATLIDFDRIHADLIAPAVNAADLERLGADEETAGGIIHKAMFERLILSPTR